MKMFVMQRTLSLNLFLFHLGFHFISWSKSCLVPTPSRQEEICPIVISCFSPMLLLCHKKRTDGKQSTSYLLQFSLVTHGFFFQF